MLFNEGRSAGKKETHQSAITERCCSLLRKIIDPARLRTWSPLIRSQMRYLLIHGVNQTHRARVVQNVTDRVAKT